MFCGVQESLESQGGTILKRIQRLPVWVRLQICRLHKIGPYELVVLMSVLIYGIIFSYFTVLKHNVFLSFGWDLGIFDQTLYNTVFGGGLLHYTAELYMIPSGSYFAAHFSPILFLVLPFYVIHPSSITLLVVQAFALAAAAFPLYLVAKNTLNDRKLGLVFAFLYLLYPPLQASNWFDFHTQAFLPLLLFSLYYFIQTKQWRFYWVFTFLALMVEEHVSIIVFFMALYFFITNSPRTIVESIKRKKVSDALIFIVTMIICVAWFYAAQSVKGTFLINPDFLTRYKATSAFAVLGLETDPLLLPIYIILNPQNVWNALVFDYSTKLFFIISLFGPLIFLPLKSKFSLITLFFLIPSMLSDYVAYHTIGSQYPLFVIPLIFIALLIAVRQLHIDARLPILKIALVVSLIFCVSLSPLSPLSSVFANKELVWYPSVPVSYNEDVRSLHNLLDLVPPNASILTQNHIFAHVSARSQAYVIPIIEYFQNITDYLEGLIQKSDYVLLDLWAWDPHTEIVFNEITENNSTFGIYALGSNSLLFRRGYNDSPKYSYYSTDRFFQPYKDLFVVNSGQAVSDVLSKSGTVAFFARGFDSLGTYGPYTYLLPGIYEITFMIRVGNHSDGYIGTTRVCDDSLKIISRKDIYGFDLLSDVWTNFTLRVSSTKLLRGIQFQFFDSGVADVYVDGVLLKRVSTVAETDFGTITFNAGVLSLPKEYGIEDGLLVHHENITSDYFWFGPYISLPPGNYTATFFLKFSPLSSMPNETILTLDVTANNGRDTLNRYTVTSSSINNETGWMPDWRSYALEFTSKEKLINVEFRGREPSPNYDIYLAFIMLEKTS